ncbi:MAG: hypothetical protein OJF47_001134 [Nitrospira sp.]|nr:MAG: hypothetical protein OJF47_001134 [Nitrospira sp.]
MSTKHLPFTTVSSVSFPHSCAICRKVIPKAFILKYRLCYGRLSKGDGTNRVYRNGSELQDNAGFTHIYLAIV